MHTYYMHTEEYWPVYEVRSDREWSNIQVQLSQEEIDWIRQVERDFILMQDLLHSKWVEAKQKEEQANASVHVEM